MVFTAKPNKNKLSPKKIEVHKKAKEFNMVHQNT